MAAKTEKKKKITKDMTIAEILTKKPGSAEVMINYGLHCVGCQVAQMESLEAGALAHGLSQKEVEAMVKVINEIE